MNASVPLSASPLQVALITFDLDGTMVDTAREIAEAANRTLAEIGLPARPVEEVTGFIGHGTRELMRGLLAQAAQQGHADPVAALDHEAVMACFERHYNDTTGTDSRLYPGCLAGLQRLQRAGMRMACTAPTTQTTAVNHSAPAESNSCRNSVATAPNAAPPTSPNVVSRALVLASVMSGGTTLGVTAALSTVNDLDSTIFASAAG